MADSLPSGTHKQCPISYSAFTGSNAPTAREEITMAPSPSHSVAAARNTTVRSGQQRGVSLVEAMLVSGILSLMAGVITPQMQTLKETQRLRAQGELLRTDLQLARNEAISRGTGVRISFHHSTHGSGYIVHTGATNQCSMDPQGQATCDPEVSLISAAWIPASNKLTLRPAAKSVNSLLFNAGQGTVSPTATLRLLNAQGQGVHHIVSIMGRVRACATDGKLLGYKACA